MKRAIILVAVAASVARARAAGFPSAFAPNAVVPPGAVLPSSSTSTGDSASSTATPIFILGEPSPSNIDTCDESLTITWFYAGQLPVKNFTLSVTNINVTQFPPIASATGGIVTGRQIIPSIASGSVISTGTVSALSGSYTPLPGLIESLTTSLDPLAQSSFTWTQANLPQGWYQILATPTDAGDVSGGVGGIWMTFQRNSNSFFIQNGSDVSCLAAIGTVTSSSSNGASSATSKTATSSAAASTNSAISSLSSTAHVNRGVIAGGVVGGVAVLVAILCAYLVFRHARRSTFPKNRNNLDDQWGALRSLDSTGFPSRPKDSVDMITALNTTANSHPRKPGGSRLGLAALGFAKPQDKIVSPFLSTAESKRNHSSPQSSAGDMMGLASFDSSGLHASSRHGQIGISPGEIEEEGVYFIHEEEDIPLDDLSPTPSFTDKGHQTDQKRQSYTTHRSYTTNSDSLGSGVPGVGGIPTAYHFSPFDTPPPSQYSSRHSSRSFLRTSLPNSSPTQTFAAFVHSNLTSSDSGAQTQSQHPSPLDLLDSPTTETSPAPFVHHQKRASSPDALVYTQIPEGSQTGLSSKAKRTHRKPVPYAPQDEISSINAPMPPLYTFHSSNNDSTKPVKAGPV